MAPPCRLIHDRLNASLSWERSIVVDESVDREECASGDEELVEKRTDTSPGPGTHSFLSLILPSDTLLTPFSGMRFQDEDRKAKKREGGRMLRREMLCEDRAWE
jgi:hypothetical protein